jgi:CheY-like chemotaxis protein
VPVRILVADDNLSMRAALRLVLEGAGPWQVIEAANGEEVLDLARTQTFSLIILDLAMPVMDGITTARVLTERYPSVPILMHTLYWSQRVAVEALKVGIRKVIPKSDKATILNAVWEILDSESTRSPEFLLNRDQPRADATKAPSSSTVLPASEADQAETPSDSAAPDAPAPKA